MSTETPLSVEKSHAAKKKVPLRDKALLIRVHVRLFGRSMQDAGMGGKILREHGAKGGVKVSREKINPNLPEVKDLLSAGQKARTFIEKISKPWSNTDRIIPIDVLASNRNIMSNMRDEFDKKVDTLCSKLPDLMALEKIRQGDLWREGTFPTEDEIRGSCHLEYHLSMLSDVDDFRTDNISESLYQEIKEEMEAANNYSINRAKEDLLEQMKNFMTNLYDRLRDGKQFKQNSIENIFATSLEMESYGELLDLSELKALGQKIQKFMVSKDAQLLRDDKYANKETQTKLEEWMSDVDQLQSLADNF